MATPLLPPANRKGKIVNKKISINSLLGKNKKSSAIVKVSGSSLQLRPKISSAIVRKDDTVAGENIDLKFNQVEKKFISIKDALDGLLNFFLDRKKQKNKEADKERIEEEKDKKKKEEAKLEKPKTPKISGTKLPSLPKFSFLDSILNFFGSILLGSLLNFLLSKRNFIFAALDDVLKGFDNVLNLVKYSIISLSNTSKKLIKSVAKIGEKLFKGPAKFTSNLLSALGKSIKNLLVKTGKAVGNFVKGSLKNISGIATGAATTRATGVVKRVDPAKAKAAAKASKPVTPTTKQTNVSTVKRAEKLFGEKGAKHLGKVSKIFKRIPFIGALIGIGIDLAMGERLDNAIAGAVGASLGATIGGAIGTGVIPIPGVGTLLGGIIGAAIGDWAGKEIYRKISGQVSQINPPPEELGEPETQPGQQAAAGGGGGGLITSTAIPMEGKALLESIAGGEGGYESVNPGTTVPGLSRMTIAEARKAAIKKGREKGGSGAMGKYQQMPEFILGRAKAAGLNPDKDLFSPENQDLLAWKLAVANYRGDIVSGLRKNPMEVAKQLRGTWPSLPGGSQQNVHTSGYLSRYRNALKKYQGGPVGPSQNIGMQYQTNTYRNQYYGAPRPGRKHAGVDLQMYSNSKQITFLGGKVVHIGNQPGGYYTFIDILTPTGKIERLAELGRLDPAVRKGATLAPGQVVSHGVGPTGVTHLEYRKPGTSGFSGTTNPLEYLRSVGAIFGGDRFQYKGGVGGVVPSSQIAKVPRQPTQSLSQQARQLTRQTSYESQQQIVPIPIPMGGGSSTPMVTGGAEGAIIPVGLSKREALNSYYQSQLIGFLYKQG